MTLVLFLLGAIGFIMSKIFSTTENMRESITMIVELKDHLSEDDRNFISERLSENDMVASVTFVSKDDKLNDEDFQRAFAVEIDGLLDENPLPDSYDVTLSSKSANKEELEQFADEVREISGVSNVIYPQDFVEELHSTLDIMNIIMVVFGGVLLVVALILLNNTVRLAVYSQRELISTLKAVGATKWFIIRPFVGRSALQGFLAGIFASLLLMGALYGFESYAVPGIGIFPKWIEIGIIAGTMTILGVVVAVVCTIPVASRFVNMKSDKIHLC
ncbi:MAG: permease-like cell division protein FtsX [Alistipes sp.]|nr:permease-like cell division protein FtsX [Alistipes sp.]